MAVTCHWSHRAAVIGDVIQVYSGSNGKTIVFCETKKDVNELSMNSSIKQVDAYSTVYEYLLHTAAGHHTFIKRNWHEEAGNVQCSFLNSFCMHLIRVARFSMEIFLRNRER